MMTEQEPHEHPKLVKIPDDLRSVKIPDDSVDLWKDCPKITHEDLEKDKETIRAITEKYVKFTFMCPEIKLILDYCGEMSAVFRSSADKIHEELDEVLTVK